MTFKLVDRVRESTNSPGTGTVTLLGAALGYQTFSAGVGANNTTYYVIADQSGANWEVGYGTVGSGGTTLARTTVLSSSNSGSLVNFSSGIQDVWIDYPANKAVFQDSTGIVSVPVLLTTSTTSTTPNLSFNASNTGFSVGASISGNYFQSVLQNKSGTAVASTNYVLSNDLGTDSTYYGEFGMNSSVFSASTPTDFFSINNGVYFSGHDGDITVGSGNGFKTYLAWGTAGQSAHVINAVGALGFSTNLGTTPALSGTTGYGTAGQVPISAGSTGAVVWSSTPTLTGTNFTGVPISTAISGLGTGVATALAVAIGSAGAPVLFNGALGTPSSGTLTNCTFPTLNQNTTGTAANVTGVVAAANGGTGQSSYAVGDLLYASTTTALSKLADVATGNALISGGVGTAPSWGKIGLTTHVSGTLAVSNGGTGLGSFNANQIHFGVFNQNSNFVFDGTNLGIGLASPFRLLTLSATSSTELVLQQSSAIANYKNWRILSTGGNSTTPSNFIIDLLNDAGTAPTINGLKINGSTGILSTPGGRLIDPLSVPAGSIIQTIWTDLGSGNYSATTGTLTNTNFSVTITPKSATSKIVMWVTMGMFFICDGQFKIARNNSVFSPSLGDSSRVSYDWYDDMEPTTITWSDSPGTTSPVTYTIWACATGCGQGWAVGSSSDFDSSWMLMEVAQ